jgi:hypothetical protein
VRARQQAHFQHHSTPGELHRLVISFVSRPEEGPVCASHRAAGPAICARAEQQTSRRFTETTDRGNAHKSMIIIMQIFAFLWQKLDPG